MSKTKAISKEEYYEKSQGRSRANQKSKIPLIITLSLLAFVTLNYYSSLEKPLERFLMFMVIGSICMPFIFFYFNMMVNSISKQLKKDNPNQKYSRYVDSNGNLILKEDLPNKYKVRDNIKTESKEQEKKYKKKTVTTEGYEELKNILIACSKNKLLDRENILTFKALIRNKLGTHFECYNNMKFSNDMHFIYTTIKSSKFTTEDYNEMCQWISNHIKQAG